MQRSTAVNEAVHEQPWNPPQVVPGDVDMQSVGAGEGPGVGAEPHSSETSASEAPYNGGATNMESSEAKDLSEVGNLRKV